MLNSIGIKHGTDKSITHIYNNRSFMDVYERYFQSLKDKEVNILEIGVLNGSSLRTWKEYFKNGSKIVGLDIDPSKISFNSQDIKIFIGSQNDEKIINDIKLEYKEGFDIIIDDGSHINNLTLDSFNLLFETIKPGGFYIIEDTHCTYGKKWWENFDTLVKQWPGMNFNNISIFENDRNDFDKFLLNNIEILDKKMGNIFGIYIYSETIIIEKNI